MKSVTVTLRGTTPYSQSAPITSPRLNRESPEAHDARCWRERGHATPEGQMYIPPLAITYCLQSTAKLLGHQIPGKGKNTYTKHFLAGVLVTDPVCLLYECKPIMLEAVEGKSYYVPANGVRGGGKRVWRCFPEIPANWMGDTTIYVLDDTITKPVFEEHLFEAGRFRGLGRFRPENGGFFGRFEPENYRWSKS